MRQGDKRIERVEIPLKRAVIGLKRPKRQQDTAIDAVGPLDLVEHGIIALRHLTALLQAARADQAAGKVDKGHLKDTLPPVGLDHRRVLAHRREELGHCVRRMAARYGLLPQPVDKA